MGDLAVESTKSGGRPLGVALGAALIVVFLGLAGCSTSEPSPAHKTAHATHAPTSQDTTKGFIYKDAPSGYAVTFPQKPDVEPLANNETDQPANFVSTELASVEFASIGQVLDHAPQLQSQLMGWVDSLNPSGQVNAGGYTLGGLDAVRAGFTTGDSSAIPSDLVGQPCEVVMAGDGNRFYQLVVIGGTADERQAFFDSFQRIDG